MRSVGLRVHLTALPQKPHGRCVGIEPLRDEILASVEFANAEAPVLELGSSVALDFRSLDADTGVHVEGVTLFRADDADHRCYSFRGKISKRVLMHLMDRRSAMRTLISPADPVRVALLDLGEPTREASLNDISSTGLSLLVDLELERALRDRIELRVAFRLPGTDSVIEVETWIRHRRLLGAKSLYGLEVRGSAADFVRAHDSFLRVRPPHRATGEPG
jgi:hypothetical protein